MKKFQFIFFGLFLSISGTLLAQSETYELPAIDVENLEGAMVSSADFENDGKPIVISFWATWCKPCILELETIKDEYQDWVDETGVKLIAISIDDTRNKSKVGPFVNGKSWEYEVYVDENGDLKRAMNVNNVPHTFVLDANRQIVWQHNSFSPGDEEELIEIIRKVSKGESINSDEH